jgi:hypothetical protein
MQPKSMGWLMSFDNHCRLISQMLDHRGPTRRTKLLEQTYDLKVCDPAYKGGACVCVCVWIQQQLRRITIFESFWFIGFTHSYDRTERAICL